MKTISVEELDAKVEELNGLYPEMSEWRQVQARKEHRDAHGVKIEPGECYYCRENGAFDFYPMRYSIISMERLIFTIFDKNPTLAEACKKARERRFAAFCRATEGLTT